MHEKLLKEAVKGDSNAQFQLGLFYQRGLQRDMEKAINWYKLAAEQGHAAALEILGMLYLAGSGIPKDIIKGIQCLEKASENGNLSSNLTLGEIYSNGLFDIKKDNGLARQWLLKIAERENGDAQYQLGLLSLKEDHVDEAVSWYSKSAENGCAHASFSLGYLFYQGTRVQKDVEKAFQYYTHSAGLGNVAAMYNLALMYLNGDHGDKDTQKAIDWLSKASSEGYILADLTLGGLYHKGREGDLEPNYPKGREHFEKAAAKNDPAALFLLGKIFKEGEGVSQDLSKAFTYFVQSAELANPLAQMFVAKALISGDGVKENPSLAYSWLMVAKCYSENSYPEIHAEVLEDIAQLDKVLTPEKKGEAIYFAQNKMKLKCKV